MLQTLSHTELEDLVRRRDFNTLRSRLLNEAPQDIADVLATLDSEDGAMAFRVLPREQAALVFEYLPLESQKELLKSLGDEDTAAIVNQMAPDDRTLLFDELPATVTLQLLQLLSPQERAVANRLLGYPEHSIGRLMTPEYVRVRRDWTIARALDHIRRYGKDSETLTHIYVVDEHDILLDDVRLRHFILARPDQHVADLMDERFTALSAAADREAAVPIFRRADQVALPVIDSAGVLIGMVTVDDVLDVAEEEATEDIQKIGGSEALDEPYLTIALPRMIRKRAGWLVVLFLGEMLTATAMGFFEEEIARAVVLALFVPLIISSGGNSGSQAATLVIRALALGEVRLHNWWQIVQREVLSGLALGSILGAVGFLRITIWAMAFNSYGQHWFLIALTIFFSLIGVVLWGTLSGSLLPLLLKGLGLDPATSSAPFVATLVDVTGLIIYFGIASVVLRGTLL
jgi:magnesium transporter